MTSPTLAPYIRALEAYIDAKDNTRAQRSLHLNWCKKRKRARETVVCEPSRFIPEMLLDDAPPPTPEEAPMSPKDRLASLKALLQKP